MHRRPNAISPPLSSAVRSTVSRAYPPADEYPLLTTFTIIPYLSQKIIVLIWIGVMSVLADTRGSATWRYTIFGCLSRRAVTRYAKTSHRNLLQGQMQIPTRSSPTASTTASTTSLANLVRPSSPPPHLSVRLLDTVEGRGTRVRRVSLPHRIQPRVRRRWLLLRTRECNHRSRSRLRRGAFSWPDNAKGDAETYGEGGSCLSRTAYSVEAIGGTV
ncbi:hypothetical protein L210DRAFT_2453634 [Boletus edulis BED1]|uniref:Uncharacterized protein n=1 Tax=Boletus edulis BED1 TaxID=1328754 RepID=A0AAD4BPK4_BOLED|nr:hypothetical protein L210DRAFT_2453634 [Boletus edulis BED1]